jgi:mRNA interferase MazF
MFERGDLLLVPYPFSDLSSTKRRPVLALTKPDSFGDFIALQVTSRPGLEHALPLTPSDLVHGALPAASYVRTNRIVTLNATLVTKIFGRASERIIREAIEQFCERLRHP